MRKIAGKVAKRLQKESGRSVLTLESYKQSRQAANDAVATIRQPDALVDQGYHPLHAVYVHVQNLLSVIQEGLLLLPELDRFNTLLGDAEDEYLPGGPPMSPVTTSFFTSWAAFDVTVGLHKETLTSIVLDLSRQLKIPAAISLLMAHFQDSRMGIYEHLGCEREHIHMRDLITQESVRVFNPSGYLGQSGELWLVRLLPQLQASPEDRITFTTPYVLTAERDAWQAFFQRGAWRKQKKALTDEQFLKYGLSPCYWLEYIHQAYLGINPERSAIFLQGVPDLAETRPHYSLRFQSRLPESVTALFSKD